MIPEEHFERLRRQTEADLRRRALIAEAAARRGEADRRRDELLADAAARREEARARQAALTALMRVGRRAWLADDRARVEALLRLAQGWKPDSKPKRRRRPDVEDGGVPVSPDRPRNLTGGAAAALDFDDE